MEDLSLYIVAIIALLVGIALIRKVVSCLAKIVILVVLLCLVALYYWTTL